MVRILTIHKAKGLEFPVVVLCGGASSGGGGGAGPAIVDRRARRLELTVKAALPGAAAQDLRPAAYRSLAEREKVMSGSEDRRLLYVALTRARDLLVVSCFGRLTTAAGEASSALLAPLVGVLPDPGAAADEGEGGLLITLTPQEPLAPARAATATWRPSSRPATPGRSEREALLRVATLPAPATSPSGLEHVDEQVQAGGEGAPPGRARALTLGSAVHGVMERCDLAGDESLAPLAATVCAELGWPDLAAEAAELAGACRARRWCAKRPPPPRCTASCPWASPWTACW